MSYQHTNKRQGSQVKSGHHGQENKPALIAMRERALRDLEVLRAYLYHPAQTGSQYIKFADPRLGSLRIADHRGIEKYKYKWNLVLGGWTHTEQDKKIYRKYFSFDDYQLLIQQLIQQQEHILFTFGQYDPETDPWNRPKDEQFRVQVAKLKRKKHGNRN